MKSMQTNAVSTALWSHGSSFSQLQTYTPCSDHSSHRCWTSSSWCSWWWSGSVSKTENCSVNIFYSANSTDYMKKKCKTSCILIEPWSANVYAESARVNTKSRERIKTYRTWGVNERGKAVLTLDANISSPYTVSKSASVQLSLISAQRCCFCVQEYVQWKME